MIKVDYDYVLENGHVSPFTDSLNEYWANNKELIDG